MPSEVMERPNQESDLPALPEDVESFERELENSLASVATKGVASLDGMEYEDFDDYAKNHPSGQNGVVRNSNDQYYVKNSGQFASREAIEAQNGALDGARGQQSAQDYYYEKMNQTPQKIEVASATPEVETGLDYGHMGRVQLAKLKAESLLSGNGDVAKQIDDVVRDQIESQRSEVSQMGRDGSESLVYEQGVFDKLVKKFEDSLRSKPSNESEATSEQTSERGSASSAHATDHHAGPEPSSRQERGFNVVDKRRITLEDIKAPIEEPVEKPAETVKPTETVVAPAVEVEKPEGKVYYESSARKIAQALENGQEIRFRSGGSELTGKVTHVVQDLKSGRYTVSIIGSDQLIDARDVLLPRKPNAIDKVREGIAEFKDRLDQDLAEIKRIFTPANWVKRWARDHDSVLDVDVVESDSVEQKEGKRRVAYRWVFIGRGWRFTGNIERIE